MKTRLKLYWNEFKDIVLPITISLIVAILLSWPLSWCFNDTISVIFDVPNITWQQAFKLNVLLSLLGIVSKKI